MDKPAALPDHLKPIWDEMAGQVSPKIGLAGMEALVIQVYRMRDAQQRVSRDGLVVADEKGRAVEHPALAIERAATREVRDWMKQFPAQPRSRLR